MSASASCHILTPSAERGTGTPCGELPTRGINLDALGLVLAWDLQLGHVDFQHARVRPSELTEERVAHGRLTLWADPAVWSDVLKRIRTVVSSGSPASAGRFVDSDQAAQELGISRDSLDRLVKQAPAGLPGAPTPAGTGRKRQHLRWDLEHLPAWFAAVGRLSEQKRDELVAPKAPDRSKKPLRSASRSKRSPKREGGTSKKKTSLLAQVKSSQER